MGLNILDIAPVISDTKICVQYLRGRNLLLNDYFCCERACSKSKQRFVFGIINKEEHKIHLQFIKKCDHKNIIIRKNCYNF